MKRISSPKTIRAGFALGFALLSLPLSASTLKGDLNQDGKVTIADATLALQIAVGLSSASSEIMQIGDVYPPSAGDGTIQVNDVTRILRYSVGLISKEDFDPGAAGSHRLTNLFFLHHSTGNGIIVQGNVREEIQKYNAKNGTHFVFWDHGYNGDGLRDPDGNSTGSNYDIPDDNTDPIGLYGLWTNPEARYAYSRNKILDNHEVIAFKSCFPASSVPDAATLQQYKTWYLAIRDFTDTRPDRLFIVMSTPPLHRLATDETSAKNARAFANWLKSSAYLSGHANLRCFDLFDALAQPDDGSKTANMLRYDYEGSHSDSDSHPNEKANQTVGPIFADFLCDSASGY